MATPAFNKLSASVHFLVLAGLLVFLSLPLTWPVSLPAYFWVKQGIDYCCWIGIFYANLYVFVPRLVFRGKGGWFVIIVLCSLILIMTVDRQFDNLLIHWPEKKHPQPEQHEDALKLIIGEMSVVIVTLILFGISTIIAVVQRIQRDQLREQNLEKEKISTELSFLKTQINPHFFFNVLHTIYALIETDTPMARDSVYTLSHMMRYVLYDTKNDTTTLEKEVAFVEDYIKLMQLRLTSKVQIIFDKPKYLRNVQVAPMLFLPFIENAFKHGISTVHPSYIYIGIQQTEDSLRIEVRNSVFNEKADNLEESNGIGLANTQRRLDLLYPQKHELIAGRNDKENEFVVKLKLSLQ